jgi:hypothetical protein
MSALETVSCFAEAVGRSDGGPPAGLRVARGDLASRFAVYRNNVAVARIGAFRDLFPVCRRLVGDDFFDAVVRAHLAERPPQSPIVAQWGGDFPDWLSTHAATRDFDWLIDTARLEAAWTRAHHAAEARPMALERLGDFAPQALLATRATLHPSLGLVASSQPIGTIWAMHQGEGEPEPITEAMPETVLVLRPEAEVLMEIVRPADAAWIAALAGGATLIEATEAAHAVDRDFDLGSRLVALVRLEAVVDLA